MKNLILCATLSLLVLLAGISLDGCNGILEKPTPQIIYMSDPVDNAPPTPTMPCMVNGKPATNCLSSEEAQSQLATAEFSKQELERQLTAIAVEAQKPEETPVPDKPSCNNTNGCD